MRFKKRNMPPARWNLLFAASILILGTVFAFARPSGAATDEAKARYIQGLVNYVQWPSQDPQADPKTPLTIGVIGADSLEIALNSLLKGQAWEGGSFQVKGFRSADLGFAADYRLCNILYIARSEKRDLASLLKALKGSSALTVSDMKGFNEAGGMVEMGGYGDPIVSTIYLDPVSAAGIFINPKFLRAAKTPLRSEYFGRPHGR
jgi:hypothetical protein